MRRRTLLATAGSSLVAAPGCVGMFRSDPATPLVVDNLRTDDDLEHLSFDVHLLTARLTKSTGPTIEFSLTNTANHDVTVIALGSHGSFTAPILQPDGSLVLIRNTDELRNLMDADGCARVTSVRATGDAGSFYIIPDGTVSGEFMVVGFEPNLQGECPPKQTYRAETLYPRPASPEHESPLELVPWGFEFDLVSE